MDEDEGRGERDSRAGDDEGSGQGRRSPMAQNERTCSQCANVLLSSGNASSWSNTNHHYPTHAGHPRA